MVVESWNHRLSSSEIADIMFEANKGKNSLDTPPNNWDHENGKIIRRDISFICETGINQQHNIWLWIDDNIDGYFYSEITHTDGGTPIVHKGDSFQITFWFQYKKDVEKFDEIANDEIAKKLTWG